MTIEDIQCYECEATFRLTFDMDTNFYKPKFCPCCGSDSIEYAIEEQEEEDNWDD